MEEQHPAVTEYLKKRAAIAGSAGRGKCKARSRKQCQRAAKKRWEIYRAKIRADNEALVLEGVR